MTFRPRDGTNHKEGKWLGQLASPLKESETSSCGYVPLHTLWWTLISHLVRKVAMDNGHNHGPTPTVQSLETHSIHWREGCEHGL